MVGRMKTLIVMIGLACAISAHEDGIHGIPADAKTHLELDCTAQFSGPYQAVTKVVIRDVTYKTPPATWDNNNSAADFTLPDGTAVEGVMNESNGNDPQEYRDSAPTEDSGWGGLGIYAISENTNGVLALVTRSLSNQRNLPTRTYQAMLGYFDQNFGPVAGSNSNGTLTCTVKQ